MLKIGQIATIERFPGQLVGCVCNLLTFTCTICTGACGAIRRHHAQRAPGGNSACSLLDRCPCPWLRGKEVRKTFKCDACWKCQKTCVRTELRAGVQEEVSYSDSALKRVVCTFMLILDNLNWYPKNWLAIIAFWSRFSWYCYAHC